MQNNQNIEKIASKLVKIKFLAKDITNQTVRFEIYTLGNLQNIQGKLFHLIS